MKFTNGYWMNRDGYELIYPKVAYDAKVKEGTMTVYAPCTHVYNMGSTLGAGMMTIELSSPLENVIKVKAYHHKGIYNNEPELAIRDHGPKVEAGTYKGLVDDDKANNKLSADGKQSGEYIFKSGNLSVRIGKGNGNFYLRFYDGDRLITSSENRALGYAMNTRGSRFMRSPKRVYMKEELSLGVGEVIYGLGERFTPFVKNGQSIDIWNEDGGTGSEQAYKNVPFYISSRGYGVYVNHSENVSYEVASEKVSRVQFSVEGECLEYCLISGSDMKEVMKNYASITSRPSFPPAWSFGLWLSTSFLTKYDEETVLGFIDGMKERDIPLDVFHFDCCWMEEFEWCNFTWKESTFPNPRGMLAKIKEKGIKVCVWINPYIGQKSKLFDEAMEQGYLLMKDNGNVWQWDMWQDGMGLVDFTNPKACKWYQLKLMELIEMGVDCFKTDFGERIPVDVKYHDGSNPYKMHNYYAYLYNKTVFDLLEDCFGKDEAVLFARSATANCQQFPVHWGGDCVSTYPSMAESLRGGLSFTMSGFGFWSHDIGGFEDGCSPDLYKRWTQFGLMSTHSRYHGSGQYKVPWLYGDESVEVTRKFTKLKARLMPYLYSMAHYTHATGIPMMRAMVLEFGGDEACLYLDRQYMLGDGLLVAPIFSNNGSVKYYLPEGKWTNILNDEPKQGGRWYDESFDYMNMPLLARENSIIVYGAVDTKAAYDYTEDVCVNIYELADGATTHADIYNDDRKKAAGIEATRNGNVIKIHAKGLKGDCKAVLWYDGRRAAVAGLDNDDVTEASI